jgi:hypothetical protein
LPGFGIQGKTMGSKRNRPRRLCLEHLEDRQYLSASVGWDGIGLGSAELRYYIADVPSSVDLTNAQVRYAVETALDAWAELADITFTETDSAGEVDCIEFRFGTLDGKGNTLAFAYFPDDVNVEPIAGNIVFDKADPWEIGNGLRDKAYDLVLVAAHEIGHALGLEHTYLAGSVMVATINADQMFGGLGSADKAAILAIYAPYPTLKVTSLTLDATSILEGESVTLTGTYAEGDTAGKYSVAIDWGDGTADTMATIDKNERTFEATHRYADDKPTDTEDDDCIVVVTITNLVTGDSDSANTLVNVANVRPKVTSLAASLAVAGTETTLTGTITDPGEEDTFTLDIYWYDGSAKETFTLPAGTTEFSADHLFPNNPTAASSETYTVLVTLKDDDRGSVTTYTTAKVVSTQSTLSALGTVDLCTVEALSLANACSYFVFDAAHDGVVTLEALPSTASEGISIKLYERNPLEVDGLAPIAESSLVNGVQRIDQSTMAGQAYYVALAGTDSDIDLRIANLIRQDGTALAAFGTDGDDKFEFNATNRTLTINDVRYTFDAAEVTSVAFAGGDGYDTVILHDSQGNDTLEAWATRAVLGNAADDATLDFTVTVEEFEELHVYARNGGYDSAKLYDSDGDDKFKAEPKAQYAKMYGGAMYNRVKFFDAVTACSSSGSDLARIFGTTGNDTFEGQKDRSRLHGAGYDIRVNGFAEVLAFASQGTDTASFVDSDLKDEFHAKPTKAQLFDAATGGGAYMIIARRFGSCRVEASSTAGPDGRGGADIAKVWSTSADDCIEATDNWLRLSVETGPREMLYEIIQ